MKSILSFVCLFHLSQVLLCQPKNISEAYRPQFHFTPIANWMNDPNGMVYYKGVYHMFYQYYPDSTVWGPMHWGHTTSSDMIHWKEQPIALYPDSLGYIFSGSAVVDSQNTSGFQTGKEIPLIAIFTYHNSNLEKKGATNFQSQGIAYSLDKGISWKKYIHNPVLNNIEYKKDFRDPKVFLYEPTHTWVLTLAVGNSIQFFQSKNLKDWKKSGEFGKTSGSHGGVWECPDLFPLKIKNSNIEKWILIVSIGDGAPNGGSGTQYFVGQFDGSNFINDNKDEKIFWVDYGPDDYAGVTWNNVPKNKRYFIGWMSNWKYAQSVPTQKWRSAMTLPRELNLVNTFKGLRLTSTPIHALKQLRRNVINIIGSRNFDLPANTCEIEIKFDLKELNKKDFYISISNQKKEEIRAGFNPLTNEFYIDRTNAGNHSFNKSFATKSKSIRISNDEMIKMHLFLDHSSLEMFADDGLNTMTSIFFPTSSMTTVTFSPNTAGLKTIQGSIYGLSKALPEK